MSLSWVTPPSEWSGERRRPSRRGVLLPDGTPVEIRRLETSDDDLVRAMIRRLSPWTLHARFFGAIRPEVAVGQLTDPGRIGERRALGAFLATPSGLRLVGHAVWDRDEPWGDSAEVAFLVEDAHQGRGIGAALLRGLAEAGADAGIRHFRAVVLPQNAAMLAVFRGSGLPREEAQAGGLVHVRLRTQRETAPTPAIADEPAAAPAT